MMRGTIFSTAALLFIISTVLWSISQANENSNALEDCCLSTSDAEVPVKIVKDYKMQLPGNGCKIEAVVFLTKQRKHLCSPPEAKWVKDLIRKINRKKKSSKKRQQKAQKKKRRQA
ncbi:C-C motif chemokine 19-like [Carcharodon carcharias]|uniref:C-C motif chemokine 19-like n=1 Tax=Carcharodon carcharias TaxID=13397 RepID=UPI001B7E113F|nr:C-C motif chemokine 19-like [Carcharodon carcharias]